jgi:hypothetical protein
MNTDRRAILSLIAMGRITPAQAERLLVVWNDRSDSAWALVAVVTAALCAQDFSHGFVPEILHGVRSLMPGFVTLAQQTSSILTQLLGGIL